MLLRYLDELSVAETAAVMGRSDSAVKALTHRGVEGLRASMTKATKATQPVPPRQEAVPDPLVRARRAVTEIRQHRDRQARQQGRTEQLAQWHSNDQAVADEQHEDDHGAIAMTTGGGAP